MPKNKTQGFIFGVIMSYAMAFGMEVYNTAINQRFHLAEGSFSSMTNDVFIHALQEMVYMGLFVILFSNLWGSTAIRKRTIPTCAVSCARRELSPLCARP